MGHHGNCWGQNHRERADRQSGESKESREAREEARRERRRARHERRRDRKERVLHTRVSDQLADDIRRMADDLRVPASNLVRNVLEEVFDVVESVSDDVGGALEDIFEEAGDARDRIRHRRSHAGRRRSERRGEPRESARDRELWRAAKEEAEDAAFEQPGGRPTRTEAPTTTPPAPVEWHIVEDGRRVGPFDPRELSEAARAGRVRPDTLVWCAGMTDWLAAGEVIGLDALFTPPPPPAAGASGDASPSDADDTPSA